MTAQTPKPLPDLSRILWAASIDASANRWHVARRVIPDLKNTAAAADDPALHQAVKHAEAAVEITDAMLEELRTAINYLQPKPAANAQDQPQETAGA